MRVGSGPAALKGPIRATRGPWLFQSLDLRRPVGLGVAGVGRSARLEQQCLHSLLGDRPVLDAPRDDEELPLPERHVRLLAELDAELAGPHEEQFVGVLVTVPDELPSALASFTACPSSSPAGRGLHGSSNDANASPRFTFSM